MLPRCDTRLPRESGRPHRPHPDRAKHVTRTPRERSPSESSENLAEKPGCERPCVVQDANNELADVKEQVVGAPRLHGRLEEW